MLRCRQRHRREGRSQGVGIIGQHSPWPRTHAGRQCLGVGYRVTRIIRGCGQRILDFGCKRIGSTSAERMNTS